MLWPSSHTSLTSQWHIWKGTLMFHLSISQLDFPSIQQGFDKTPMKPRLYGLLSLTAVRIASWKNNTLQWLWSLPLAPTTAEVLD